MGFAQRTLPEAKVIPFKNGANSWLHPDYMDKFPSHVRAAAHRAANQSERPTTYELAKRIRAVRSNQKNEATFRNFHVSWLPESKQSIISVSLYGTEIVRWLSDLQNVRSPRFAVTIGNPSKNTLTTRRAINGICHHFGVRYYCWTHDYDLWAMWNHPMDEAGVLTISPILPQDWVMASRG